MVSGSVPLLGLFPPPWAAGGRPYTRTCTHTFPETILPGQRSSDEQSRVWIIAVQFRGSGGPNPDPCCVTRCHATILDLTAAGQATLTSLSTVSTGDSTSRTNAHSHEAVSRPKKETGRDVAVQSASWTHLAACSVTIAGAPGPMHESTDGNQASSEGGCHCSMPRCSRRMQMQRWVRRVAAWCEAKRRGIRYTCRGS